MANFNIFGKPYNNTTGISLIDTNGNTHDFYDYESFGTKTITSNGEYSPWDDGYSAYSAVTVNVSGGGSPSLQNKTVSPTTSQQTIQADSGYDGLGTVTVNAMPSGTAGTPTATKGTVSNHSISVTPKVTNTTGYITGSTKTGTAVTVSASELVSGTLSVTANGTADVTNYASVNVNVSGGGATNYITGTFNYSSSGAKSITLPYTGNGYPTQLNIFAVGGVYGNDTYYDTLQRYAVGSFQMLKYYPDTAPTYTTSGSANYGVTHTRYKSSASNASSITTAQTTSANSFSSSNSSASSSLCAKFLSKTTLSVFIALTSYGFMDGVEYEYHIIYSE